MAHFANIDENNTVVNIVKIDDEFESFGNIYINKTLGLPGKWIQTSYNTYGNQHGNEGVPMRGNYAIIGGMYDETLDVFLPRRAKSYMILNTSTYQWEYPVPMPTELAPGEIPIWNESIMNWEVKLMSDLLPTDPSLNN